MRPLEPIPAIRRIETDRPACCAFDVVGHVSAADIENLLGLLEGAFVLHRHVDLLLRLVDPSGVDWGQVDAETVAEGQARIGRHVRRIAIVGDRDRLTSRAGFFASHPDIETRHFAAEEEAEAWAWLQATPQSPEAY